MKLSTMNAQTQLLQQRWEALDRQVQLIRQLAPADAGQRIQAVLDWREARMDELEIELGSMATQPDKQEV